MQEEILCRVVCSETRLSDGVNAIRDAALVACERLFLQPLISFIIQIFACNL